MRNEQFDFYDSSSLKIYNLNQTVKYQLQMLERLDGITKRHCENVGNLSGRICQYLRLNSVFTVHCTTCGYLHDIGKSLIPREIIEKPTSLTDEEYEIIKTHTTLGYKLCMEDLELRPYAEGAYYHHEALNGTGYPQGLTSKDIPFVAKIIRVADEYDALVNKRHYTTHVHITEALKELIKDANPVNYVPTIALSQLSENSQVGKISPRILKALFKVVIDDILYEISSLIDYLGYLKDNIKRLEQVDKYLKKKNNSHSQKRKDYYEEGAKLLLQAGESFDNYKQVVEEYKTALTNRQERVGALYDEIKLIKKLKV